MEQDTIFALSSGRPPAAIAVIRISGPAAIVAGEALTGQLPDARHAAVRFLRDPESGDLLDEALVLRFAAPASATGEDLVEFHCHGGRAVVDAVLKALGSVEGLRPARPGEFTRRAFENGRIDLTEAEGLADLLEAETESQRKAALALAEGGLRRQIEDWQQRLLDLSAEAERAIDYVDEDEEAGQQNSLLTTGVGLAEELNSWLARPPVERLKDGVLVVIAGPVNAGKSSLLNAIAGEERSIVTPVPGTTRDHVEVTMAIDGTPVRLTDTAGLRDTDDTVEAIGVERSRGLVASADILLWLGDAADAPRHSNLIQVHSKIDLPERRLGTDGGVPVSSVTGDGLAELMRNVATAARGFLPTEDVISLNRRQAALVRKAERALREAGKTPDPVLAAEQLRIARGAFDRLTGRAGVEQVLDALFGRFCLGK